MRSRQLAEQGKNIKLTQLGTRKEGTIGENGH